MGNELMREPRIQKIDAKAFAMLEQAAVAKQRCPMTHPHGPIPTGSISRLAEDDKVYSETFALNFRRVTILVGPHAGKRTADPTVGDGRPYKTIGDPPRGGF